MTHSTPVFGPALVSPPIDPELISGLEQFRRITPPLNDSTLPQMREMVGGSLLPDSEKPDLTAAGKVHVEELLIPGPETDLALTVLRPAQGTGPWPLIYNIHGGGMVVGTRHTALGGLLSYCASGSAVVASIEYRLAPEATDLAPVTDCYAGLRWCAEHADRFDIDAARILVHGGSAGGGLAAGTALMARDQGFPHLTHQILACPMLDDRLTTYSSRMLDHEGTWDRNDNLYGWNALLGARRGTDDVSYYVAPARAQDLTGLPRTFIDVGSVETFRDEAIAYALRLSEAGVAVDLHMWGGGFHAFETFRHTAVAQAASAARVEFIRRALEP